MDQAKEKKLVVFSYSHKDKDWLMRLLATLKPRWREGDFELWHDGDIDAGSIWRTEIETALQRASLAVLLVSIDFLASDFIADNEIPPLLARADAMGLPILWVPISSSLVDYTEIEAFQAAWDPKQPLAGLDKHAQDHALTVIARAIAKALDAPAAARAADLVSPSPADGGQDLARLAAMPEDRVPEPAELPSGSFLPFRPNANFTGRDAELKALARTLNSSGVGAIGEVGSLTGMGGVGKTQLAIAFAYRYGRHFPGSVFWVSLAEPGAVPAELARCGQDGRLGQSDIFSDLPLASQVSRVQQAWLEPVSRLLIFDNCEDEALLEQYRPASGGCRVLVTSRKQDWADPAIACLPLTTLRRADSIAMLQRYPSGLADEDAARIAQELGDLPLALHLAGSFLKRYRSVTPADYLAALRAANPLDHESLKGRGTHFNPTRHDLDVGKTFAVSMRRLDASDRTDELARALLASAAFFAPGEPIPADLLVATLSEQPDDLDLEDALARLAELGLINLEGSGDPVIHRLVACYADAELADSQTQPRVEDAILSKAIALNKAGYPKPLLAWQAHLRVITNRAVEREDEQAAGLCNTLGDHLQSVASYGQARPYYEQALAIWKKVLGNQHPHTSLSLNNLGYLLQAMGELEAARPYYEQALAIWMKVSGDQHPHTALSLNNLGYLLRAMGELEAARPYFEQALAIWKKVLGDQHPHTAQSLNNLGALLNSMGELEAARPYYEQALAIRKKVLGDQHPDTAQSLNNLGYLLQAMGELEAARPYYEQALAIWKKVLGDQHPDTALSLNNLGGLLDAMGELEAARPYYEQALAIWKKVLGDQHPDTALGLNNLGGLLYAMGELEAARPYLEQALAILASCLGPDHPDTKLVRGNLAELGPADSSQDG